MMNRNPVTKNQQVSWVDPNPLKPNPVNSRLYLDNDICFEALVEDVAKRGIITPIRVTKKGVIIAGHRRCRAALANEMALVPVIYEEFESEADEIEALLNDNLHRGLTPIERTRVYREHLAVEKELAKKRQGQKGCAVGEAKNLAAKAVGWSRPTAEKALEVLAVYDQLEKKKDKQAKELFVAIQRSPNRGLKWCMEKRFIKNNKKTIQSKKNASSMVSSEKLFVNAEQALVELLAAMKEKYGDQGRRKNVVDGVAKMLKDIECFRKSVLRGIKP